jgi:hypothetical protein
MATHIKHLLNDFLREKKKIINDKQKIEDIIDRFLDKKTKNQIQVNRISQDRIICGFNSSTFAYVFSLHKEKILAEIQKKFPAIKTIKIEMGKK